MPSASYPVSRATYDPGGAIAQLHQSMDISQSVQLQIFPGEFAFPGNPALRRKTLDGRAVVVINEIALDADVIFDRVE